MNSVMALIIGALISIMLSFNGQLEQRFGLTYSLIIIHCVGLIGIIIILLIKKQRINIKEKLPIYLFCGGSVGVVLTISNIVTIEKVGVALTTSLAVFGQLVFSCLVDHYGWFGMKKYKFQTKKLVGFAIILLGLIVMTK